MIQDGFSNGGRGVGEQEYRNEQDGLPAGGIDISDEEVTDAAVDVGEFEDTDPEISAEPLVVSKGDDEHSAETEISVQLSPSEYDGLEDYLESIKLEQPEDVPEDQMIINLVNEPEHYQDKEWLSRRDALEKRIDELIEELIPESEWKYEEGHDLKGIEEEIDDPKISINADILKEEYTVLEQQVMDLYKDVQYKSGINMTNTPQQLAPLSCTLAVCAYALNALAEGPEVHGERDIHAAVNAIRVGFQGALVLNNDVMDVADRVKRKRIFGYGSMPDYVGYGQGMDIIIQNEIFNMNGLEVEPVGNVLSLIHELELGGVVVCRMGGHSRLIQAVKIDFGEISFSVIDPLGSNREPDDWSFGSVSGQIKLISKGFRDRESACEFFAIKAPKALVVTRDELS